MFTKKRVSQHTLRELIDKIPWVLPLTIAFIISFFDLSYMCPMWAIYAGVATFLVGLISYYYFFFFYRFIFIEKLLRINYLKFWRSAIGRKTVFLRYTKIVIFEELLFRYIPIYILSVFGCYNALSLVVIVVIFIVLHIKFDRKNRLVLIVELFLFFFLQALLYSYIMVFPLLLIPHFTRNICISEVQANKEIQSIGSLQNK